MYVAQNFCVGNYLSWWHRMLWQLWFFQKGKSSWQQMYLYLAAWRWRCRPAIRSSARTLHARTRDTCIIAAIWAASENRSVSGVSLSFLRVVERLFPLMSVFYVPHARDILRSRFQESLRLSTSVNSTKKHISCSLSWTASHLSLTFVSSSSSWWTSDVTAIQVPPLGGEGEGYFASA